MLAAVGVVLTLLAVLGAVGWANFAKPSKKIEDLYKARHPEQRVSVSDAATEQDVLAGLRRV